MDIFCVKCNKKIGQTTDGKAPTDNETGVTCPECSGESNFTEPVDIPATFCRSEEPPPYRTAPSKDDSGYDFTITAIISEAWVKTTGMKGPIWASLVLACLAVMAFSVGITAVAAVLGSGSVAAALEAAAQVTISVAGYPFMAGLALIAIRRSVDRPVDFKMAFSCFSYTLPIVIASLLVAILSFTGFMLLVLPGIYLSVAYLLVVPLIFDKGMGPWQAMETSRKAIQQHWFKVFGLYIVMSGICLLSAIPFGLGLIWTVPMFIMVGGILYREVFGVSQKT